MVKINFHQPKFILPAIIFLPLLGLGWLTIDIFQTETQAAKTLNVLSKETSTGRYGKIVDWSETKVVDSIGYDSKYSEVERHALELQHLADSLKESKGKAVPVKESEWKEWNTLEGAASNVKTGIRKALSFCADVIDHEAVPVYIKTDMPADSIN